MAVAIWKMEKGANVVGKWNLHKIQSLAGCVGVKVIRNKNWIFYCTYSSQSGEQNSNSLRHLYLSDILIHFSLMIV